MERNELPISSSIKSVQFRQKLTPKMWKRDEVLLLLDIYEATFLQSNNESDDELWNTVSLKLSEIEIHASPAHCKSKWNLLHKAYLANPDGQGTFFKKVKQIIEAFAKIEEIDETTVREAFKEERLETVSEEEVEPTQINSTSITVERVTESPNTAEPDGINTILETLCRKIDALTEAQYRQEARLEEVYQMQRTNQDHLLDIKKHLKII
uniref:Myb/SANT-like DNA-binding domain-containing protein n=1 Tax=Anopheles funestus TaxID=62324 RepID=A0A182RM90_ANOFN